MNRLEERIARARPSQDMTWTVVAGVAGIMAGLAVRRAVASGWKYATDQDVPVNPASDGVTWAHALGWAAVSGIAVAVGRVVAKRAVAGAWQAQHQDEMRSWKQEQVA